MAKKKRSELKQAPSLADATWVRDYENNETLPIFFCNPHDEWGFLGHWYSCSFREPPPPGCEDFPYCDQCQAERKRFASLGQYVSDQSIDGRVGDLYTQDIMECDRFSPYVS